MSSPAHFTVLRRSLSGWLAIVGALCLPVPARAGTDNGLQGPYPFLTANDLSLHGGYALGLGSSPGGPRVTADYDTQLAGSAWLDLQLGFQNAASCADDATCQDRRGKRADVMGGIKAKFRTPSPLVPYARLVGGLLYGFPDHGKNGVGPGVRGGVGATYFLYDWFGLGAEANILTGRAAGSHVSALDLSVGVELAF